MTYYSKSHGHWILFPEPGAFASSLPRKHRSINAVTFAMQAMLSGYLGNEGVANLFDSTLAVDLSQLPDLSIVVDQGRSLV